MDLDIGTLRLFACTVYLNELMLLEVPVHDKHTGRLLLVALALAASKSASFPDLANSDGTSMLICSPHLPSATCLACLWRQVRPRKVLRSLVRLCGASWIDHEDCVSRGTVKTDRQGKDRVGVHKEILDQNKVESFDSWSFTRSEKGEDQVDVRGWHVARSLPRPPDKAA
jgi:hypothetical protein